jgi:hypothetical protein
VVEIDRQYRRLMNSSGRARHAARELTELARILSAKKSG